MSGTQRTAVVEHKSTYQYIYKNNMITYKYENVELKLCILIPYAYHKNISASCILTIYSLYTYTIHTHTIHTLYTIHNTTCTIHT